MAAAQLLRIAHVNLARGFGLSEQQTLLLIRNLAQMGVQQMLICRDNSLLPAKLRGTPFLKILKVSGVSDPRFSGHFKVTRRYKLVCAHDEHGVNWAFLHFMMFGVPYVMAMHEHVEPVSSFYNRTTAAWAAAVVCAGVKSAEAFGAAFKVKCSVIHNSVSSLKPFAPHVQRLKDKYSGRLLVGQIGPLINRLQGQSTLIDAARLLENKIPDLVVLIIGEGSDLQLLKEKADGLPNIKFLSLKHHTFSADYIAAMDIYVSPVKEGDEFTEQLLLDVMDLGTPVITTALPGITDFMQHGVNGFVLKDGTPEELAQALLYMRDHAAQRRILAERAKNTAAEHLPEDTALAYYQLFQALMKDKA